MTLNLAGYSATFPVRRVISRGNRDEIPIDHVLLRCLVDSVDQMRHVVESSTICQDRQINPEALHAHIPVWERGQMVNSAGFIKEMSIGGKWSIPRGAIVIAKQILAAEAAYQDELEAASLAGVPWRETFYPSQKHCMRCGGKLFLARCVKAASQYAPGNGLAPDPPRECRAYLQALRRYRTYRKRRDPVRPCLGIMGGQV